MFEFFLALFGGLYYGGKSLGEKAENKKINKQTQAWIKDMKNDYEEWIERVVDDKLEYEISQNHTAFKAMEQRILKEVGLKVVSADMVIAALLAQKAKIPKNIAMSGIYSRGVWDYVEQQRWVEQRLLMIWYDKELRRNGLDEPLLFVEGYSGHHVNQHMELAVPVKDVSKIIGGRYFWAPMRRFVS